MNNENKNFIDAVKDAVSKTVLFRALAVFFAIQVIFIEAILATIILWNAQDPLTRLLELGAAAFLAWGVVVVIQTMVRRPRPFENGGGRALIQLLIKTPSFPSGHSAISFAIATVVFTHNALFGGLLYVLALGVAFSRVIVGVHGMLDIFVGALIGILFAILTHSVLL